MNIQRTTTHENYCVCPFSCSSIYGQSNGKLFGRIVRLQSRHTSKTLSSTFLSRTQRFNLCTKFVLKRLYFNIDIVCLMV